jgi:hypothetical protein
MSRTPPDADMAKINPSDAQSANEYADRSTEAVKSVLVESLSRRISLLAACILAMTTARGVRWRLPSRRD